MTTPPTRRTAPTVLARVALLLPLVALGGCDLLSSDPAPQELRTSRSALSFDAIGDTATLSATVFDQDGVEMVGQSVSWSSSDPAVASITGTGLVTAVGRGTAALSAQAGEASGQVTVTVTPAIAVLEVESEDTFTGTAGDELAEPISIRAVDRLGNPILGAELEARVDLGDGSLDASTLVTDAAGRASVRWTLGPIAGSAQQIRIVAPPSFTRFFTATANAGPVDRVRFVEGGRQAGQPGQPLAAPIRMRLEDRLGNPRPGLAIQLEVVDGAGTLSETQGTTDDDGLFETRWTLGPSSGTQRVRVTHEEGGTAELTAEAVDEAAALEIVAGDGAAGVVDQTADQAPSVRLVDELGNGLSGIPVIFEVDEGELVSSDESADTGRRVPATTDADGVASLASWKLGTQAGLQTLTVRFPGLGALTITARAEAGAPAGIELVRGNRQVAITRTAVPDTLQVRALDAFGNAVSDAAVALATNDGTATLLTPTTGPEGTAEVTWTLGDALGLQTLTATVADQSVEAHAAVVHAPAGDFGIDVVFTSATSPSIWAAFQVAASRWAQVIVDDVPDVELDLPSNSCGERSPAFSGVVDDLLIWARIEPIDGPFSVLGSAGPCWIRDPSSLPIMGRMRFDVEDLERIEQQGTLQALILHEIGHVLGIGSLWRRMDLLADPSLGVPGAPDTHFTGPLAIAAFDEIGGADYDGAKVPVENIQGGAGTRDAHWRESVFDTELMTGFLDATANPMSAVTIQSLADQGYTVSLASVEAYGLPGGASGAPGAERNLLPKIPLVDDVWRLPIRRWPVPPR